jgi:hypothetical protein
VARRGKGDNAAGGKQEAACGRVSSRPLACTVSRPLPSPRSPTRPTLPYQRLLEDLDDLDWADSIKEMQRNWIGRSEGAEIEFEVCVGDGGAAGG